MILRSLPLALAVCLVSMTAPLCAGEGSSSTTNYWYGGELHPLVITRDGVTYRLLGKSVVEALAGNQVTRSYAHADHLGSVRMVTDDGGSLLQSLSYDDYGLTRIAGQSTAATDESVASFYRFQGQEQEIFPLAKLGIENDALAAWLDQVQLYHFPWRDYAAGLAVFTETDPIPARDSLYASLAANPVNVTDETGGMIEESKYDDDDDEDESAQLQQLLKQFARNPEMRFTPKEHGLLGKAYSKGNVFVAEIEQQSALRGKLAWMIQDAYEAANAAAGHEERRVLMDDVAHFEQWHGDAVARVRVAEQKLMKFEEENALLGNAWRWSVLSLMLSKDDSESDDDNVMTDLLQSMTISPSPAPSAEIHAAAPEDSTVPRSQAEEVEEKTEEANEKHDAKGHETHEQMKNFGDGSS